MTSNKFNCVSKKGELSKREGKIEDKSQHLTNDK
jgi:hypothetical protein